MAFTIPGSWPAPDPVKFGPISDDRLRSIVADAAASGPEGMSVLAQSVNSMLANLAQRDGFMVFANDLSWTDTSWNSSNQVVWRQPWSKGLTDVDYQIRCQITGAGTNKGGVRIQGADGTWITASVASGGWQTVSVNNVDIASASSEYFDPIIQGQVDTGGDQLDIRTISWREDDLATIPAGGLDSGSIGGADDATTFDIDDPLSADAIEEMTRAILWWIDERNKAITVRVMGDGTGAHPTDVWTSSATSHPDPVGNQGAGNVYARFLAATDWFYPRDMTVWVEAKSNGAATGSCRVADLHGNDSGSDLDWTSDESSYSWKSTTITPIQPWRREGAGDTGTEFFVSIKDNLTVRAITAFAADTSHGF